MIGLCRRLGPLVLVAGLLLPALPARAQEEGAEGAPSGESSGNPLYGYLGVAVLGSLAVFALCKTARR